MFFSSKLNENNLTSHPHTVFSHSRYLILVDVVPAAVVVVVTL